MVVIEFNERLFVSLDALWEYLGLFYDVKNRIYYYEFTIRWVDPDDYAVRDGQAVPR